MLDEMHGEPTDPPLTNDKNQYVYGSINNHNTVIIWMTPGLSGAVSAPRLVRPLRERYPNLKVHLFVGIGGGVPRNPTLKSAYEGIFLGDIVVGWPDRPSDPPVVAWDTGRLEDVNSKPIPEDVR
ncbi:hypothetical protein K469DRAFT_572314 [Zopfia rhizophila CBS 207.26]|uniref:Nucleoside phosphorylase domain-containing protein n=1 Tax=Zopfia rhizophila CBS 207.26 TaxID=1314779 RepID=A0A6A6E9X5_9PEZI|nr:hypothetical protein K469DRAFT_572314 [Zopfia rhizophila CBS 207.26]